MPYTTFIKKICPICGIEFETKNRTKKTCTRICAGKSTIPFQRKRTDEELKEQSLRIKKKYKEDILYRERVSIGVKNAKAKNPEKISRGKVHAIKVGNATKGKYKKNPKNILSLSARTVSKIIKRLGIGCSLCGWKETSCDIHHINGRKCDNADYHENLTYICPNCHRMCHAGLIPKEKLINLKDFIGDKWREHYFG